MEIKACIDEIVRLEERKRELAEQIAECKAAAKSEGFNVTAINRAVKLRLETDAQRQKREAAEEEAELYEAGRVEAKTAARVADERRIAARQSLSRAEARLTAWTETTEPRRMTGLLSGLTDEQRKAALAYEGDDSIIPHDADGVVSEAGGTSGGATELPSISRRLVYEGVPVGPVIMQRSDLP